MELLILSQVIATFVAFTFVFYFLRRHKTKRREAPTPSGALPIIGHLHLLGGKCSLPRTLGSLADKLGPIFMLKLGVHRTLVVSNAEMIKECFSANDRVFATRPHLAAGKHLGFNYAVFVFSPYGLYWREIRKASTIELLSNTRLHKLRHVRIAEVDTSIKELYSGWAKDNSDQPMNVEMKEWFEHLTFNVITKLIAGKRYYGNIGTVGNEVDEAQRFQKAMAQFMYLSGVPVVSDAIPYCEWVDLGGHVGSMKSTLKEFDSIIGNWIDEHRHHKVHCTTQSSRDEEELDFIDIMLSVVLESNLNHSYDCDTVIKATALQLIAGGYETTYATLTWALSLLLSNKEVLKKAQEELDIHVGNDRRVEESDINKLEYLQAIVKETLRLYPPVPLAVPHEAMEDCQVGGYAIQKGTRLLPNIWKLHRDPHVWSEPHEFKPERFLTTHVVVDYLGKNFEFIPFGSGLRACPGITFAKQILHLILAHLLQGFNLETTTDEPIDMTEALGITMPKETPLNILLTPRLPSKLYEN